MACPKPKPYVQLSLELMEALIRAPFSGTQAQIVWAVVRKTLGDFQKNEAPISQSLLRKMTGRSIRGIQQSLAQLVAERVIDVVHEAIGCRPAVLHLNQDYEAWGRYSVNLRPVVGAGQELPGQELREVHAAAPLDTHSAASIIDIDIDSSWGGRVNHVPHSWDPGSLTPSELVDLKPHIVAALHGQGFGPELSADVRAAIRRGEITEEMVGSWR